MPRRSAAASGLTIGFIGSGQIETEAAENLILDFLEANLSNDEEEINFILAINEETFSDTLGAVCDLAKTNDIPYTAVIDVPGSAAPKSIKKYIDEAVKSHKVEDVEGQVVKLLGSAPRPHLFILFDEQDEKYSDDLAELGTEAFESDIKVFDLTDALAALQPDGAEEGEGDGEPEPEPEPEPVPRRRRSSAKAEPEPEPEEGTKDADADVDVNKLVAVITKAVVASVEEFFENSAKPEETEEAPAPRRRRSAAKADPEPEVEAAPTRRRRTTTATTEPEAESEAPRRSRGRPRKDGTPAQPRTPDSSGRLRRRS